MGTNEDIERYWQEDSAALTTILTDGMTKYTGRLGNINEAFKLKDHSLRCMDEGTPGGIHCAGSGILLDVETIKNKFAKAELDGIYSHEGCGAAALYAKQENLDATNADEFGIEWAKALAENLGLPYKGHISADKMDRPAGLHVARVAYYDGTGCFDPSQCADLPKGFVVSRKYMSEEYALKEIEVAINIALGHHGLGERFCTNEPFLLIAVAKSNDKLSLEKLKQELETVAKNYNGKVKVDGFEIG